MRVNFHCPGIFSAFLHYKFEALFNENLMFEYNLISSKTISICHRKISFVPKRILRGPTTDFFFLFRVTEMGFYIKKTPNLMSGVYSKC